MAQTHNNTITCVYSSIINMYLYYLYNIIVYNYYDIYIRNIVI